MTLAGRISALSTRMGNYIRDSVLPYLIPPTGSIGQVLTKTGSNIFAFQDAFLKNGGTINGELKVSSLMIGSGTRHSLYHGTGSEARSIVTTTTAITLGEVYYVITYGASSYTITLPAASTCTGRTYEIKNRNGNKITSVAYVATAGNTTNVLTAGTVVRLVSDGTDWQQF